MIYFCIFVFCWQQSKESDISGVGTLIEEEEVLQQSGGGGDQDSMMLESASQVASDITNAIQAKKQEIDEKKKSLEMMKKAMVSRFFRINPYKSVKNDKIMKIYIQTLIKVWRMTML